MQVIKPSQEVDGIGLRQGRILEPLRLCEPLASAWRPSCRALVSLASWRSAYVVRVLAGGASGLGVGYYMVRKGLCTVFVALLWRYSHRYAVTRALVYGVVDAHTGHP